MTNNIMALADALAQAAFNNQMKQEDARAALQAEVSRVSKDAEQYRGLIKEARKIIRASASARSAHADWLNRTKDLT